MMFDLRATSIRALCLLPLLWAAACARSSQPPGVLAGAAQDQTRPAAVAAGDMASFAHDDPGQPGLALPKAIARALGTDERVLSCAEGTRDGVSLFRSDWVAVRRLDLDGDGRADWIVNGRHACLRADDAAAWWAYADDPQGQRLVLSSASASALDILAARTHGFRDLRLRRGVGEVVARYDGAAYALPEATTATAPPAGAAPAETPVDTVAGRLEIAESPSADDRGQRFRITLAGRELRRTGEGGDFPDYPLPRILGRYEHGIVPFDEVLVFQQHMYGNACNGGPLWILGLRRDGTHAVSRPIDFCGGKAPQLSATHDELTIVLPGGPTNRGEGAVPTETWHYRNGEVMRAPAP